MLKMRSKLARRPTSVLILILLARCSPMPLSKCAPEPPVTCYQDCAVHVMSCRDGDVRFWTGIRISAAIIAGIAGVVATVMIALQGDDNKYWTRPVGIVATAMVTGLTSLVVSFHIPENVSKVG